jgi:predicted alpha/beta superfamily hydrolase
MSFKNLISDKETTFKNFEIIGNLEFIEDFKLDHKLLPRKIVVWLPKDYYSKRKSETRYNVLYMHDGQNLFDPNTSYAGKHWMVAETISKLLKQGKILDLIVVGIYNTPDRLDEYDWSKRGRSYIEGIISNLKPYIDSKYRTLTGRENTAIMGSSMGGLISFYAGWFFPDVFSMSGCMSSSFYYHNDEVLKLVSEYSGEKIPVKFYIDHGEDGLIRGQKMFCLLSQKGYVIGTDIDYFYAPNAEHNEAEWASRLERPILFFFGNNR